MLLKKTRIWNRFLIWFGILILAGIFSACLGAADIPPSAVLKIIAAKLLNSNVPGDWSDSWETIILQIRLPRIALAAIVGSALSMSGATYQGLFRNPLADPYLIGVAAGAGLGATVVIVTEIPQYILGVNVLPIAAFIGASLAVTVAYVVVHKSDELSLSSLVLAGVAVASFAGSITALLMIRSDSEMRVVVSWLMGGLIGSQWHHSIIVLVYLIPSFFTIICFTRTINILQLGEEHARQVGVNVGIVKLILIAAASLATAAAVSFSGLIGFVGLIAPHAVRLIWGADYRIMIPMAAMFGGVFLILADLVARMIVTPAELPIGVVTAFCGAPFFLYLLRYRKKLMV